MPTYAYVCEDCGHQFDEFQSITAKPLRKCPACGRAALKRLIGTGAAIIFKGSGFYCTDYRSDGYKKTASTDASGTSTKAGDKKETKTEVKPTPTGKSDSGSTAEKKKSA